MKKTTKNRLTATCALAAMICGVAGIGMINNYIGTEEDFNGNYSLSGFTVYAAEAETECVIGKTKYNVSVNKDYLLAVTTLTDISTVYEVGYDFGGSYTVAEGDQAEKNKYYTSIKAGENIWSATDIFGETYTSETPMIVWEVAYNAANEYSCKAYAKTGTLGEDGLLINDPETVVYGNSITVAIPCYTITLNNNNGTANTVIDDVAYGTTAEILYSETYLPVRDDTFEFIGWYNGTAKVESTMTVTQDMTLVAKYSLKDGEGISANSAACIAANGNVDPSYDYKWVVLPIEDSVASVGDTLEITMDMFIRPDESTWENMPCTMSGDMNPYVANGTQAYLQADKTGNVRATNWAAEELGQWHTFTFYAEVIDQKTIQRDAKNAQITIDEEQYVLLWWYSAGNGIAPNNNGAKAEWYYKQPTTIVNHGRIASSQNDVDVNFTHKWIAIEIDESVASVGDTVQITMEMFIKPENCAYENVPCVAVSFWDNNTVNFGTIKSIQADKTGAYNANWAETELGQWHTFTFEAVVIDQAQVLKDTKNTAVTMPTKPYVLLWWQSAGAGKTNAAAEWRYKQPTSIVNNGKAANSQNDVKYTSFTHKWIAIEIDESIASVGDTVQITMEMFINPENCAYENVPCVAVSFWDNNTINFGTIKSIQADKTGAYNANWAETELGQWHTFTFEAVVIDQAQVLKDTYNTAVTMPTKPYVLLWWQSAGAGKTNAAAEWRYKQPTSIQKI